jgi:hypothetical protein
MGQPDAHITLKIPEIDSLTVTNGSSDTERDLIARKHDGSNVYLTRNESPLFWSDDIVEICQVLHYEYAQLRISGLFKIDLEPPPLEYVRNRRLERHQSVRFKTKKNA